MFDLIAGLPVHPLVVHLTVVILPLSALGLLVIAFVPRWRRPYGWVVLAGLVVGTVGAFVAKESGEALAERVGLPKEHADLGDWLPPVAVLLLVVAAVWFWLVLRSPDGDGRGSLAVTVTGIVAAVLALVATGLTIAVGHSGAEAVWAGEVAPMDAPAADDETDESDGSGASPGPSGSATEDATITMTEVAAHTTAADCWSVVNGTVYDLTDWIAQHPGGAAPIEDMCGIDATTAFTDQHGTQRKPNQDLSTFAIGTLS